jgi:uncharacterized membrane protein
MNRSASSTADSGLARPPEGITARVFGLRRRRSAVIGLIGVALTAAMFIPFALTRFVDGDEGIYGLVARLVIEGDVPYRDFAYPQMPLLPYAYGAWLTIAGESWTSLRILSALLAVALAALLYLHALRRFGPALRQSDSPALPARPSCLGGTRP